MVIHRLFVLYLMGKRKLNQILRPVFSSSHYVRLFIFTLILAVYFHIDKVNILFLIDVVIGWCMYVL